MPRSGADARLRLQKAALELYGARGFEATTTAEIAAEAGLTERTFFRHFADKREVLFDIEATLRDELAEALADVPDSLPPLSALLQAFRAMVPTLEGNRALAEQRHRVISGSPALRERELAKVALLSETVASALRARGLGDRQATLLAQVGSAAIGQAIHVWLEDPVADMDTVIVETFADLHELAGVDPAAEAVRNQGETYIV